MKKKKSSRIKLLRNILFLFAIILVACGTLVYIKLFSPAFDIKDTAYVYIDERKDYNELLLQLQTAAHIKDLNAFKQLSTATGYQKKMRTGRYAIQPGMTIRQAFSIMANGIQSPVKLTFNNIRLKQDFTKRMGEELMFKGDSLLACLDRQEVCARYDLDTTTILCMFIPNTYEIYWNTTVEQFMQRMKKEYDRFWTEARREKAAAIPLSPVQVSILASIVEEETAVAGEYATVAGLYINRLKNGMLLQADPTVKFAVGDFSLRRILNIHLKTDSPYNTYLYKGLPPGPIRLPSIRSIDAVLNYQQHNYIFMCAKEDFSGRHNFATNIAAHNQNAAKYRQALNRRGIY